ncbi:MAG: 2Fe-2S iron-sulfur cluster-binding protein [Chloroflexi bacterium]|nr:2Fe-2S iron-sulfur cluster-binding protein [Chloroflexota bacterium]
MDRPLTLFIRRTRRAGGKDRYWQQLHVAVAPGASVLDALEAAQQQDPTLMFRHSCHHASCGSCGMRIQGKEALACLTPALETASGGVLRLEPLRNFPLIGDLVVDTSSLARKLEAVGAQAVVLDHPGWQRFASCIECGLCVSACPVSAVSEPFLGPAALAAAFQNAPRTPARALAMGDDGVWRCRSAFECSAVCPAGVQPAEAIMQLRKDLLLAMFRQKGGRYD